MSYVVINKAILTKKGTKDIGEEIKESDFDEKVAKASFEALKKIGRIGDAADFKKAQDLVKTMPSGNKELDASNKKVVELTAKVAELETKLKSK